LKFFYCIPFLKIVNVIIIIRILDFAEGLLQNDPPNFIEFGSRKKRRFYLRKARNNFVQDYFLPESFQIEFYCEKANTTVTQKKLPFQLKFLGENSEQSQRVKSETFTARDQLKIREFIADNLAEFNFLFKKLRLLKNLIIIDSNKVDFVNHVLYSLGSYCGPNPFEL